MKAIEIVGEIQIGDWVMYSNSPDDPEPIYVTIDADDFLNIGNIEDAKPIPLTDEILKANGIQYQFGSPWYQGGYNGTFEFRYTSNDRATEVKIPVKYVHELQHVLRLCKIQKEIII